MQTGFKMGPGRFWPIDLVYFTNIKRMYVNAYISSPNIYVYVDVCVTWDYVRPIFRNIFSVEYY